MSTDITLTHPDTKATVEVARGSKAHERYETQGWVESKKATSEPKPDPAK